MTGLNRDPPMVAYAAGRKSERTEAHLGNSKETNPGHDLRRDTGGIQNNMRQLRGILKTVGRHYHDRHAPTLTCMCVRMPADHRSRSSSNPIRLPREAATASRMTVSTSEITTRLPSCDQHQFDQYDGHPTRSNLSSDQSGKSAVSACLQRSQASEACIHLLLTPNLRLNEIAAFGYEKPCPMSVLRCKLSSSSSVFSTNHRQASERFCAILSAGI